MSFSLTFEYGIVGFLGDLFPNGLNLPSCSFGECALPSDQPPDNLIGATPKLTTGIKIGVALAGAGFVFIAASLAWCAVMSRKAKLMPIAPPRKGSTLAFDKLSYNLQNGKKILNQVSGVARAGQVFAIMGPSGAGKSTFLDIIAAKEKRGKISGSVLTDGRELHPSAYRSLIGFVDQEDLLMPTLTVRETLMFSATLRLPECISALERTRRVDEIIATLGLTHIANSRVGGFGFRGISGGEKRRLSIGVELVTSPAVLFLDEPTSGLDSSSALSVVRTLADLAHVHGKTVVFTIHQPRSDVFTLFDQVLVLARGSTVYCGPARDAGSYFREHGAPCPEGYNIADHLLDIATLHGTPAAAGVGGKHYGSLTRRRSKGEFPNRIGTVVRMVDGALTGGCEALAHTLDMDLVAHSVSGSLHTPSPPRPRKPRAPPAATRDASTPSPDPTLNPEDLDATAGADADSISGSGSTFTAVPAQTHARRGSSSSSTTFTGPARLPPPSPPPPPPAIPSSRYQTSFLTQVNALLRRSTLSLIRTPSLLLAHLSLSLLLGVLVGALYYKSGTTLGGIQNRLGGILFLLLLVGFSSLSAVGGVARERALMSRERSGNCYGVLPMFISRLLVDTVALRILPAIVLGTVVFVLVGFNGGLLGYLRFIGVIVLFAMQMGLLCVGVGVAVEEVGTGTLGASIGILFMMLFAGFLINKDDIPKPLSWMQYLSYFKYAQEALAVNDLTGVQISDSIAGSDISVSSLFRDFLLKDQSAYTTVQIPASIVLQKFGFDMNAYYPDLFISIAMTVKLLVVVLIMMKLLIREKR
ncbi:hypothetical protein HK101_001517 [Irineochytrium annulatum]|nr:hypothetical protein HK101_001517 [Irineochytrium annulatum]